MMSYLTINQACEHQEGYNEVFRQRTKQLALDILKLYKAYCLSDDSKLLGRQLIRSATSVAANYRASIRARSSAEKFSKLCIVVEEADETVFWLELLNESALIKTQAVNPILTEATEILKVMSSYRNTIKNTLRMNP